MLLKLFVPNYLLLGANIILPSKKNMNVEYCCSLVKTKDFNPNKSYVFINIFFFSAISTFCSQLRRIHMYINFGITSIWLCNSIVVTIKIRNEICN